MLNIWNVCAKMFKSQKCRFISNELTKQLAFLQQPLGHTFWQIIETIS